MTILNFDVGLQAEHFRSSHLKAHKSWQHQILVLAISYVSSQMSKVLPILSWCRPGAGQVCADPFHSNADPDPHPASQNDEAFLF